MSGARAILLKAELPDLWVTLSSEVCPEVREYERTSTAVANAYVQPLMESYLARMQAALAAEKFNGTIYLVTSGGGLTAIETARRFPVRLVESGPGGRRDFRSANGGARRRKPRAQLRHGWHHGQDLPDRRLHSRIPRGCSRSTARRASSRARACRCAFP